MKKLHKIILSAIISVTILIAAITYYTYKTVKTACSRVDRESYELKRKEYYNYLIDRHTVQNITFKTKDGLDLSGFLIQRPEAKRVILLCHGYRQAKEFLAPLADLFDKDTLFLFDFRTQGSSKGNRITFGSEESMDIHAALEELSKHKELSQLPVYGLGISMGAVALIKAAYENVALNGLVLDSSYAILKEQSERAMKRVSALPKPLRSLGRCMFETIMGGDISALNACILIQAIKTPVLIIHSEDDKITPVCDAHELYKRAQGQKELWIVHEAPHAHIYNAYPDEYKHRVISFFESLENNAKT